MTPTFDSLLEQTVKRNLVKFAAGRQIFCPYCDTILDCKRTVVIEAISGERSVTATLCGTCWDKQAKATRAIVEKHNGKLEVDDGRLLWPSRSRKSKPSSTAP